VLEESKDLREKRDTVVTSVSWESEVTQGREATEVRKETKVPQVLKEKPVRSVNLDRRENLDHKACQDLMGRLDRREMLVKMDLQDLLDHLDLRAHQETHEISKFPTLTWPESDSDGLQLSNLMTLTAETLRKEMRPRKRKKNWFLSARLLTVSSMTSMSFAMTLRDSENQTVLVITRLARVKTCGCHTQRNKMDYTGSIRTLDR